MVITAPAHGLSNSDQIGIFGVGGMVELNGNGYVVANKTANTFELSGINGTGYTTFTSGGDIRAAINSTNFTTYVSDGVIRERSTVISGLDHLEGQAVKILAEGATHADKTVTSGALTLDRSCYRPVSTNPWRLDGARHVEPGCLGTPRRRRPNGHQCSAVHGRP